MRGDALQRVPRQRMQTPLAVDQRPRARRADLPAGQAQLRQQGGHLGTSGDEGLRANVHRLAADAFGAQHTSQPVGRVEQGYRCVWTRGYAQPVRGDKT